MPESSKWDPNSGPHGSAGSLENIIVTIHDSLQDSEKKKPKDFVKPMPKSKKKSLLLAQNQSTRILRSHTAKSMSKNDSSLGHEMASSAGTSSQETDVLKVDKSTSQVPPKKASAKGKDDLKEDSGIPLSSMIEPSTCTHLMQQEISVIELDCSDGDVVEDRNLYVAADTGVEADLLSDPGVMMSPVELLQNQEKTNNPPEVGAPTSIFDFPSQLDANQVLLKDGPSAASKKRVLEVVVSDFTDNLDSDFNLKNSTMIAGGKGIHELPPDISKIGETVTPAIPETAPNIPNKRQMPFAKGISATNPKKGKSFAIPLSRFEGNDSSSESDWDDEPTMPSNAPELPPLPLHVAFEDLPAPSRDFEPIEVRLKKNPKFQAKVQRQRAKVEADKAVSEAQKKRIAKKPRPAPKKRLATITPFSTNRGNLKFYAQYKVTNEACEKFHVLVDEWANFTLDQVEMFCADENQTGIETKEDVLKLLKRQGIVRNYWEQSGLCHELLTYDESDKLLANDWPDGKQLPTNNKAPSVRKVPRKKKTTRT